MHDELKDKDFILEMSWIGEGGFFQSVEHTISKHHIPTETQGKHQLVPEDLLKQAVEEAKVQS